MLAMPTKTPLALQTLLVLQPLLPGKLAVVVQALQPPSPPRVTPVQRVVDYNAVCIYSYVISCPVAAIPRHFLSVFSRWRMYRLTVNGYTTAYVWHPPRHQSTTLLLQV